MAIADTASEGLCERLVDELVNDRVLTFLRRSLRRDLGEVLLPDVKNAYIETVRQSGKEISEEMAQRAANLTDGYPYMVQLIGYYMWQSAQRDGRDSIAESDIQSAFDDSLYAFGDAVCEPALNGVSLAAREFVYAMVKDNPCPTRVSDIATRVNRSPTWANTSNAGKSACSNSA